MLSVVLAAIPLTAENGNENRPSWAQSGAASRKARSEGGLPPETPGDGQEEARSGQGRRTQLPSRAFPGKNPQFPRSGLGVPWASAIVRSDEG